MIRSIISDLGKVLIHFDNRIFYGKLALHSSLSQEEIAERVNVFSPLGEKFDVGRISPREFHAGVCREVKAELGYDEFFALYNDVFSINSSVIRIMERLAGDYRLVLLSNTDVQRFGFIKRRFPEVLIFDEYVLSYEVGWAKPSPPIYRSALDKAQAPPSQCVFIDDRPENIAAAQDLGLHTVLFSKATRLQTELSGLGLRF